MSLLVAILTSMQNLSARKICSLYLDLAMRSMLSANLRDYNNNNGRNGSCLTWLATSLEEKRRWLVINASPRGQCSK